MAKLKIHSVDGGYVPAYEYYNYRDDNDYPENAKIGDTAYLKNGMIVPYVLNEGYNTGSGVDLTTIPPTHIFMSNSDGYISSKVAAVAISKNIVFSTTLAVDLDIGDKVNITRENEYNKAAGEWFTVIGKEKLDDGKYIYLVRFNG